MMLIPINLNSYILLKYLLSIAITYVNRQHFIKKPQVFVQFNTLPLQKVQLDREESLILPRAQKGEGNKKKK